MGYCIYKSVRQFGCEADVPCVCSYYSTKLIDTQTIEFARPSVCSFRKKKSRLSKNKETTGTRAVIDFDYTEESEKNIYLKKNR